MSSFQLSRPEPAPPSSAMPAAGAIADGATDPRPADAAGVRPLLLKGKNVGLLCDDPSQAEALEVYRAATELGARVALIRPRFFEADAPDATASMAGLLGRLYDAIACVALPPCRVAQLRDAVGVPVLDDHSIRVSRDGMPKLRHAEETAGDRRGLWQAALIDAFN
jgi:ornithine carbamoyltransferase